MVAPAKNDLVSDAHRSEAEKASLWDPPIPCEALAPVSSLVFTYSWAPCLSQPRFQCPTKRLAWSESSRHESGRKGEGDRKG